MEQYAVFNPINGEYTKFDNTENALDGVMKTALDFYMKHTHNQPISKVIVNEDGSETWMTFEGVDITTEILKQNFSILNERSTNNDCIG